MAGLGCKYVKNTRPSQNPQISVNLTRSLFNFGSEIVFWAFLVKLPVPIKSYKLYLDIYDNHKSLNGGLSDKKNKKHRWRRNLRRTMSVGEIITRSRWSSNVKKNMKPWKSISEGFTCTDVASRLVIRVAARELSFEAKGDVCDPAVTADWCSASSAENKWGQTLILLSHFNGFSAHLYFCVFETFVRAGKSFGSTCVFVCVVLIKTKSLDGAADVEVFLF